MIDVEAESADLRERSVELAELLDVGRPALDPTAIRAAQSEATRLGRAAHAARQAVAERLARGEDPGCPVSRARPIRRVRTDARGRDLDGVLRGRSAITPELRQYFEHQRDVVGPTIEGAYRRAVEDRPWQPALVAAVHGHLGLLRLRETFTAEGGEELDAAHKRYQSSYGSIREGITDAQHLAAEAMGRLANLEREAAQALIGDDQTIIEGLIASAVAQAMPEQIVGLDGSTIGTPIWETSGSKRPVSPGA